MRLFLSCLILALLAGIAQAQPQTFSSGSTGADGALTYAANLGLVYFPPSGLAARTNNIYNFTTITIGAGTTVRLSGWVFKGPVYWLASGDVTISGTLDLSGQPGHPSNNPSLRAPSEPGAGGYSGGVASTPVTGQNATAGSGPGGGLAAGFEPSQPDSGQGGTFSGGTYLQPLIGGSGGGGGCAPGSPNINNSCTGGGAGGGAILIASSTQITVTGLIDASGGAGPINYGGAGSGGAVRLVANAITESNINVGGAGCHGGCDAKGNGGDGIARLEAFNQVVPHGEGRTFLVSIPYNLALPVGGPSTLSVTSINGVSINANPFSFPDTTIATGTAVPVVISGVNIPSGTTGNLYIFSENTPDQVIPFTLTGTPQSTSATVNVPYPAGGSRGFAKAIWMGQ
jgi:hypothetical protein